MASLAVTPPVVEIKNVEQGVSRSIVVTIKVLQFSRAALTTAS